jgi:hypothetical protein
MAQPAWIAQPPQSSGLFLYGVGIAHDTSDKAADRQRADDAARADIARQLRVTIDARLTTVATERSGKGVSYDTRQAIESSTTVTLEGVDIKERYYDKKHKTYYALARLNRQNAAEQVAAPVRLAARRARTLLEQADRLASGDAFRALLAVTQAAEERASAKVEEGLYRALSSGSVDALLEAEGVSSSPFSPTSSDIGARIDALIASLAFIDIVGDRQTLLRGSVETPVTGRLVVRWKDAIIPAAGFPIRFDIDRGAGRVEQNGMTGPDGSFIFPIHRAVPAGEAHVELSARIDTAAVRARFSGSDAGAWLSRLAGTRTRVLLLPGPFGFEDGVAEITGRLVRHLPEGASLMVGRFTYEATRIAGPFTGPLRKHLIEELSASGRARVIDRMAMTDNAGLLGDPNAMETLARAARVDAILWGEYHEAGDSLLIEARITGSDGVRLGSTRLAMRRDAIPVAARPPSLDADIPAAPTKGIPVRLWTDRGDGSLYMEGERLTVYLQTDTDCYLRLLYRQADGQVAQIFPNDLSGDERINAGKVYTIPDGNAAYTFVVRPPFGVEYLIALASPTPFPVIKGSAFQGGVIIPGASREVVERLTSGKPWYGQTVYRMTTTGQ